MLSPVSHTSTRDQVAIYQTEPYVVAADVYGEPPHVGRGGWTWYTGSAGWMFRVAIESIFGVSVEGGHTLVLNPSVASDWPNCRLVYRLPNGDTRYDISIENPAGKEHGVSEAFLDEPSDKVANGVARIPIVNDGASHRVAIGLLDDSRTELPGDKFPADFLWAQPPALIKSKVRRWPTALARASGIGSHISRGKSLRITTATWRVITIGDLQMIFS